MITLSNLSKYYTLRNENVQALQNINLAIKPQQIYGIIGRSGAGKSTLIRCVNLLERPSQGKVLIAGKCLTTMSAHALRQARRQMGMIFQHFNLLQSRNVSENICLPLELAGMTNTSIKKRVDELLILTELKDYAKQYPSQLSGGQKQRVAIARALANSPQVLLCDEATSALDPQSTYSILQLLKTINQELGITILLITHEMDVVKTICHQVAVLNSGQIVEKGNVVDLFVNPQTQITKDLVSASWHLEIPLPIKALLQTQASVNSGILLRIAYQGESASEPIISHLIQQYQVKINILQGSIETIQNHIVGILIVEMQGIQSCMDSGIEFLQQQKLQIEILGYVQRNH